MPDYLLFLSSCQGETPGGSCSKLRSSLAEKPHVKHLSFCMDWRNENVVEYWALESFSLFQVFMLSYANQLLAVDAIKMWKIQAYFPKYQTLL